MKHLLIALPLLLTACQGGKITPAESILTACQTFNSALVTITTQNNVDPLSDSLVRKVDMAVELTDGVCGSGAPDINATALDIAAVQGANVVLQAVMGGL